MKMEAERVSRLLVSNDAYLTKDINTEKVLQLHMRQTMPVFLLLTSDQTICCEISIRVTKETSINFPLTLHQYTVDL
jgi:hypothetical protein